MDRPCELVATPRDGLDRIGAQQLAKRRDLHRQVVLLHHQAGPGTIEDLVTYAVLETDLPPPLHAFDPNLGGLLQFWADVTLHIHYELPPGRLDPDNASHVPYINLWIDILAKLAIEEQKINADIDEDDDGVETENSAASSPYGLGQLSAVAAVFDFRISRRALARARRDPIKRFALGELWQT